MDVQVEHLEGHIAQLTVTIPDDDLVKPKQQAARRLAKNLRIPGFRPGKAPYAMVVNYVGEAAILEETLDSIGNDVYREALEKSDINPATSGEIIKVEPQEGHLALTFHVPKAAEVDLKAYRDIRQPLEVEPITDEVLDKAMEALRESRAVVEDVERAAEIGDELEMDARIIWWHEGDHDHDEEDEDDSDEAEDEAEDEDHDHEDDDHDHSHGHEHVLLDDRAAKTILRETGDEREMLPGISAHLIGMSAGEEKIFSFNLPDDFEQEDMRGQEIKATVKVSKVRSRTLPEMNDTFAASATNGEQETLQDLRVRMRQDLEKESQNIAENKLFEKVFDEILAQSEIQYHEVLVDNYTDNLLDSMDRYLKEQAGLQLKDYMQVMGISEEQLRQERREDAIQALKRDAVVLELMNAEKIMLEASELDAEMDRMLTASFGEQASKFRKMMDTPEARQNIAAKLLNEKLVKRMVAVAQGENPPIVAEENPSVAAEPDQTESIPSES